MPFAITEHVMPLIACRFHAGQVTSTRFLGSCFWINTRGMFATCKHVLERLKDGEHLAVSMPEEIALVTHSECHPTMDFAVGRTDIRTNAFIPPASGSDITAGVDVEAWGYLDRGRPNDREVNITARIFKGNVVRMAKQEQLFPSKSILEFSFAAPEGFSGTALLHNRKDGHLVVGMVYGNTQEATAVYPLDGSEQMIPMIVEIGLAHFIDDIIEALEDMGLRDAWE